MNPVAFCFPGQGSQRPGMLDSYAAMPAVAATVAEAGEALGEDLVAVTADQDALDLTRNTQPALLAMGVGVLRAWLAAGGPRPVLVAGHSLGEFAALVAAGCLGLADAVRLVRLRAEAMQAAVPADAGAMCAILGLEADAVREACATVAGAAWVANLNAPGQVVISGRRDDVGRVATACREAGAKRCLDLPVSVPSHCPLMRPAADALAEALAGLDLADAEVPVVQNATATPETAAPAIKANLVRQLVAPVDWVACATALAQVGQVIECGPAAVLHGLNRRIVTTGEPGTLRDADSIRKLLA